MEQKSVKQVVNWSTYLPKELLEVILNKLIHPSDYVRFGAVCKSWRSVAVHYKQLWIKSRPPLLLITNPGRASRSRSCDMITYYMLYSSKLYNIFEDKVYNQVFQIPYGLEFLGSSYGWLAFEGLNSSVILINFFTGGTINLPTVDNCSGIYKVILSCDPSTCRDHDLVVAARYYPIGSLDLEIAFVRPHEKSWTSVNIAQQGYIGLIIDIIFHKGMLYALGIGEGMTQQLLIINYHGDQFCNLCWYMVEASNGDLLFPEEQQYICARYSGWYLVEASNGDLLLLVKQQQSRDSMPRVGFKIYKLIKKRRDSPAREEFYLAENHKLDNDDTIFVGPEHSLYFPSSSCVPDCNPKSVYSIHNHEVQCFENDGSKKVKQPCSLQGLENYTVSVAWISPSLR